MVVETYRKQFFFALRDGLYVDLDATLAYDRLTNDPYLLVSPPRFHPVKPKELGDRNDVSRHVLA